MFSITIAVSITRAQKVYQFTCTEQKATDDSEVQRSLQSCGFSVRNRRDEASWRLEFGGGSSVV
jgi:hypothetical protein